MRHQPEFRNTRPGEDLSFHPLADIFPMMSAEEMARLVADIGQRGLIGPIVLYENKILDGRNRYNACASTGVEPRFMTYTGTEPLGFVLSKNLSRCHLDASQRAMVAAELAKLPRGANQHSSRETPSQAQAAAMMKVGRASVHRARKVLDKGSPELVEAVKKGDVKVSVAAKAVGRTADKYVAQQEAKIGPVTPVPEDGRKEIKAAIATVRSVMATIGSLETELAPFNTDEVTGALSALKVARNAFQMTSLLLKKRLAA